YAGSHGRRQSDILQTVEDLLSGVESCDVVVVDDRDHGQAHQGHGAQMGEMCDTVEFDFERDRNLLLDFFGDMAGPLRDDLGVGVGHVGIGLDRQDVERDDAPDKQDQDAAEDEQEVRESEINSLADHAYCPARFSETSVENSRALVTSSSPGFTPARISCMPSGARPSALMAILRN